MSSEETVATVAPVADATPVTLDVEQAKTEALRQVEFYFNDANLPFDKFLFTLTQKDPQGWVPISTIASFKRMRSIKEQIGLEGIVASLKHSKDLLEVNEDGQKVRRKKDLVPVTDSFERSIYAKGFEESQQESETLQKQLETFFQQFGTVNVVRMRRDMTSEQRPFPFKGSVFVEFANVADKNELLKKAAEKDPQEDGGKAISFEQNGLVIMSKQAYVNMKCKEKGINPASAKRGSNGTSSAGQSGDRNGPKKFNAFKEMNKPSSSSSSASSKGNKPKRTDPLTFEYNGNTLVTLPDGTVDADSVKFPEQSVIQFTNAGSGGNWKDLKDTLLTIHPTSFVEFPSGATQGAVGFKTSLPNDKFDQIVAKNMTVGGNQVEWIRVDESKAKQFYLERANFRASFLLDQRENRSSSRYNNNNHHSGGKRGGGRFGNNSGGRGGGGARGGEKRKRPMDSESTTTTTTTTTTSDSVKQVQDAPPSIGASTKKAKTEE